MDIKNAGCDIKSEKLINNYYYFHRLTEVIIR